MSRRGGYSATPSDVSISIAECDRHHRASTECHRRIPAGPQPQTACRHLNRSLAGCLLAVACPEESEDFRSLCFSGGTSLKLDQCQQRQLSLCLPLFSSVPTLIYKISYSSHVHSVCLRINQELPSLLSRLVEPMGAFGEVWAMTKQANAKSG